MKKIISLILVLTLIFSFSACGKAKTAEVKISDLEGKVVYDFEVEPQKGVTAGELVEKYFVENGIPYEKYSEDMIQSIGDLEQESENWTVYFEIDINGEYATKALWNFELNPGDLLEIKLIEANW